LATVQALLSNAIARLRASGSESPRLDAEVLLGYVLGIDRTAIIAQPEAPVGDGSAARFEETVARREAGEPVAYIRGVKEFRGLAFGVDARALIPRPETERLVELAGTEIVRRLTGSPRPAGAPPIRILDVGTGSGAVAIAIAVDLRKRRMLGEVEIVATDRSPEAIDLARENAVAHAVGDAVTFEVADLRPGGLPTPWDVIAANLPYVRTAAVGELPRAASFEPVGALDGGPDGLTVIGRLVDLLPEMLAASGVALLEIGGDQQPEMLALVATRLPGWYCEIGRDLGGLPRVARIERARPA
jgi:release factor glutamine methyltransferase